MKKYLLTIVLALLGMTQMVAEEYEYVPFVREGVKWVYVCYNYMEYNEPKYYSFEMSGDELIGEKYYKPVIVTHYNYGGGKEVEDFIPVYLREEDRVVYAIQPEGIQYPQCPVGIGDCYSYWETKPTTTEEFILYDFNDPVTLYDSIFSNHPDVGSGFITYTSTDMVTIGNHQSKCHHYQHGGKNENDRIIEGIGYDGNEGTPLFYFELISTGFQVGYMLSHVIEDGEIIYKGINYDPNIRVGIDEVVAEKVNRPLDPRYYDLMGRAVGTEVPTTPGIYIHQGKKICVSQMP